METLLIFKIGGSVIDNEPELNKFLHDFAMVPGKKILVHGGGKWISELSQSLGVEVTMIEGRRMTDAATLRVVQMVLPGLANKTIVAKLQKEDCNAIGLTGADGNTISAKKRPVRDGMDFGYVGDVKNVNETAIEKLIEAGFIPVFTAMTHDGKGQMLNTNADTIASVLATGLAGIYDTELYFCFEKLGVLENEKDESSVISKITLENYKTFREAGSIHSGMIPKIDNAFDALKKGVRRVHICRYNDIGKIMEDTDFGTQINLD